MSRQAVKTTPSSTRPAVRVRMDRPGDPERSFTEPFRLGRDVSCDVQVEGVQVSRVHAEVYFDAGDWWVRDLQSTNGLYVDGQKVDRVRLSGETALQLGRKTRPVYLCVEPDAAVPGARAAFRHTVPPTVVNAPTRQGAAPHTGAPDPSLSQVIRHYFDEAGAEPAGKHTQFIREAYRAVQQKQKRRYAGIIAGAVVLCLLAVGYAVFQHLRSERLQAQAADLFAQIKALDVMTANLRRVLEETEGAALDEQLADIEARRRQMAARYDGFVEELGLYRRLSEEERLIYRVARIFNESEFRMPAAFVGEVKRTIREYWMQEGRQTYITGIRRAQENGYVPFIVRQMQQYGLPPEFFYLALQESVFRTDAVGPATRWGIAKGMWQFIPSTARRYGLQVGPREDLRVVDPQDDRMDFEKSTAAAARYLHDIYSTPAQASGLLVMASYNWGEHRVIKKLEDLPSAQSVFEVVFEGIPENPEERNYWQFLQQYEDRMPEETKDYVLKIFSAAVIGQDPRRFGFDFDDPLSRYIEAPEPGTAANQYEQ